MDTNLVAVLVAALANQKAVVPVDTGPNSLLIAGMFVAAITPTLAAIAAYFKAKSAQENTEKTKLSAIATADSVDKIHIAVNSERSALLETVKTLRDEILRISKELAESKGQKQEKDIQTATAAATAAAK